MTQLSSEDCPDASKAETCLLVLCGLPGAGKTALACALAQQAEKHGVDACIVSFDDLGCQPSSRAKDSSGGRASGSRSPAADNVEGSADAEFSPEEWQQARQRAMGVLEAELQCRSSSRRRADSADAQQEAGEATEARQAAPAGTSAGPCHEQARQRLEVKQSSAACQQHRQPHEHQHCQQHAAMQQQGQQEQQGQHQERSALQQQEQGEQWQPLETRQSCGRQRQYQRQHRLVVADDNMQYRSMRWQCYSMARAAQAAVVLLHLQCSEQLAQQRNAGRPPGQRVPADVITRMASRMEEPGGGGSSGASSSGASNAINAGATSMSGTVGTDPEPGSSPDAGGSGSSGSGPAWESGCLVVWDSSQALDAAAAAALWRQVWERWGPPAPPPYDAAAAEAARAAAQAATAASLAHAVDLATRQVLSDCMRHLAASAGQQYKAAAAKQLNAGRRQLLQEARVAVAAGEAAAEGQRSGTEAAASHWAAIYRQQCERVLQGLGPGLPGA